MDDGLNGPAEIVQDAYKNSVELATQARERMQDFLDALNDSIYTAPSVDVEWATLGAPVLPPVPTPPVITVLPYSPPGTMPPTQVTALERLQIEPPPTDQPPVLTAQPQPVHIGQIPALPALQSIPMPTAPALPSVAAPRMLALQEHTFGGINLREEWLDKLADIPELSLLQPTKLQYQRGAAYTSQLMETLKASLHSRMGGGTGLNPAVEQAIWARARDRETVIALAAEREVMRAAESFGFPIPAGAAIGGLADARRAYHDKLSGLSRDIAIKQADLEQANLKDAIGAATQLESKLIDYSYQIEQLVFQAAKALADNEIQAFNANIERFKALLVAYQAYAGVYDSLIKAEMGKIEVFKARLSAEQAKAQINIALTQQYKAEIEASGAVVEIFKAQVSAVQAQIGVEQVRIQAAGEQIKAFVATTNAEVSKVEVFKAQVGAHAAEVEGFKARTQAYAARAAAQGEVARIHVSRYQAESQSLASQWEAWKAQVAAKGVEIDASGKSANLLVEGYKIAAVAAQAHAEVNAKVWEAQLKQYEAGKSLALQAAKINNDALIHANDAQMEAAKVGAQVMSQQTASAFNIVNTTASISGSVTQSI